MFNTDFKVDDYIPTEETIREGFKAKFDETWDEAQEQLSKKLVIGFMGTASSGKSSAIKAIFDIDPGDISPIPGSTKEVKVLEIDENLTIIDCPGFGDIDKVTSEKAHSAIDDIDIYIYVINSEGGYKIQEKEDYSKLSSAGKDVLVVLNKIDLTREGQREEFVSDMILKMGVNRLNFIPVAFDPLPQISDQTINVDKVYKWIYDVLVRKGKDILFAKHARAKDKICDNYINAATVSAAAIGALPIPGSDYVALTALQGGLVIKITHIYNENVSKEDVISFVSSTFAGQTGRQLFRAAITALKVAGWLPGPGWALEAAVAVIAGGFAASITFGLGHTAKAYYRSNMQLSFSEIQSIFESFAEQFKAKKKGA